MRGDFAELLKEKEGGLFADADEEIRTSYVGDSMKGVAQNLRIVLPEPNFDESVNY
jgi:hypothetical protein